MVGRILYLGQFIMNLVSRIVHFVIEMLNWVFGLLYLFLASQDALEVMYVSE